MNRGPYTLAEIDDLATGKLELQRTDRHALRLTRPELAELAQAKRRGYLVDRCRRRICLANVWFLWCEARGWPYLVVRPARRHAEVELDFFSTLRRLPRAAIDALFERALRELPEWRGQLGDLFSHMRVRRENADACARLMLEFARQAEPEKYLRADERAEQARLDAEHGLYATAAG